jgi:hypothetical protein
MTHHHLRRRRVAVVVLLMAVTTACAGRSDDASQRQSKQAQTRSTAGTAESPVDATASSTESAASSTLGPSPTAPPPINRGSGINSARGDSEQLLLARQAALLEAGNGELWDCSGNLGRIPRPSMSAPAVWLDVKESVGPVEPIEHVALCLFGFDPAAPIDITVTTGGFTADSIASTSAARPSSYFLDPRTLFVHGSSVPIQPEPEDPDFLTTDLWQFVPPQQAREEMARTGTMEIIAGQGSATAAYQQLFEPSSQPAMEELATAGPSDVRVAVRGFNPGAIIPVGLYRLRETSSTADLEQQVGTVRADTSGVAEYFVPQSLLHSVPPGKYCISLPVGENAYCVAATDWFEYPGEARPGDTGDKVHFWRQILIQAGEIDEAEQESDEPYSPGLEAIVRRLQESWGWAPDGIAGPGTYARLTGLPRPAEPTPAPERE